MKIKANTCIYSETHLKVRSFTLFIVYATRSHVDLTSLHRRGGTQRWKDCTKNLLFVKKEEITKLCQCGYGAIDSKQCKYNTI